MQKYSLKIDVFCCFSSLTCSFAITCLNILGLIYQTCVLEREREREGRGRERERDSFCT